MNQLQIQPLPFCGSIRTETRGALTLSVTWTSITQATCDTIVRELTKPATRFTYTPVYQRKNLDVWTLWECRVDEGGRSDPRAPRNISVTADFVRESQPPGGQ